jgi:hypothetical protein
MTTTHAAGPFDVKVIPQKADDAGEAGAFARMFLDKYYHGDLEGPSKGQMMATSVTPEGSGAYVALERVSGTLHGRRGSFVLMHNASMTRGVPAMNITVVPESGTGELVGLQGRLLIIIEKGAHSYELDYTLP